MHKALEILNCIISEDNNKLENMDEKNLVAYIREAIEELEEAIKPKTCDGCVYFRDDRQCWIENINNYLTCKRHTFELAMVDRYEPKDNA